MICHDEKRIRIHLLNEPHNDLSKAGVGHDTILLADLTNPDLPDYKLYIFSNALYLPAELRAQIKKKLARNGASALWLYAPGYVTDDGYSTGVIQEMTGIRAIAVNRQAREHLRLTATAHPVTENIRGRTVLFATDQSGKKWGPLFYLDDPDAYVLGVIHETDKPGFAMKKSGTVTNFYSTAPNVGWKVIRRANFKSIGFFLLITRFLIRQNHFGASNVTFHMKSR